VSFRTTASTTSRSIETGAIHRPRPRAMVSLGPRHWPLGRPTACQGWQERLGAERLAARRRLRRYALEALATAMATGFLTSLALAHPAALRDAPTVTLERTLAAVLGADRGSHPLSDCP
jgi:hypothetical protein